MTGTAALHILIIWIFTCGGMIFTLGSFSSVLPSHQRLPFFTLGMLQLLVAAVLILGVE